MQSKIWESHLPEDLYFKFFSFLSIYDISGLKKISTQFNALSTFYLSQPEHQIFYAVSPFSRVKIGTWKKCYYGIHCKMNEKISVPTLLSPFKYKDNQNTLNDLISTFYLFRTESEAINFMHTAGPNGKSLLFEEELEVDGGGFTWDDTYRILTTPIYRVQICDYSQLEDKRLIGKEEDEHSQRPLANAANLFPLSASIKYCLFGSNRLKTIRENIHLNKSESDKLSITSSIARIFCCR